MWSLWSKWLFWHLVSMSWWIWHTKADGLTSIHSFYLPTMHLSLSLLFSHFSFFLGWCTTPYHAMCHCFSCSLHNYFLIYKKKIHLLFFIYFPSIAHTLIASFLYGVDFSLGYLHLFLKIECILNLIYNSFMLPHLQLFLIFINHIDIIILYRKRGPWLVMVD